MLAFEERIWQDRCDNEYEILAYEEDTMEALPELSQPKFRVRQWGPTAFVDMLDDCYGWVPLFYRHPLSTESQEEALKKATAMANQIIEVLGQQASEFTSARIFLA